LPGICGPYVSGREYTYNTLSLSGLDRIRIGDIPFNTAGTDLSIQGGQSYGMSAPGANEWHWYQIWWSGYQDFYGSGEGSLTITPDTPATSVATCALVPSATYKATGTIVFNV
jgi:hypothetical protein